MSVDWGVIEAEYISDHESNHRSLAKKHGVKYSTISARALKGGWSEKRQAAISRVVQETTEKTIKKNVDLAASWNERALKTAARAIIKISQQLDDPKLTPAMLSALSQAAKNFDCMARLSADMPTENTKLSGAQAAVVVSDDPIEAARQYQKFIQGG